MSDNQFEDSAEVMAEPASAYDDLPVGEVRPMIVTDLDRTLIYSPAALQLPGPDILAPTMVSVEVLDGRPSSFMTQAALSMLSDLAHRHPVVPCTTRTREQFERLRLPLGQRRFAITSNGGTIIEDGRPDREWRSNLEATISAGGADLAEIRREAKVRTQGDWVIKRRTADDLFCYLVVDLAKLPPDFFSEWTAWCAERGWRTSMQGRKIYSIPQPLSKSSALNEVAKRLGVNRVLAAGDGGLDSDMLEAADLAIRPRHGELAAAGWRRDHLTITENIGVLAGEEMVRWFADNALPTDRS